MLLRAIVLYIPERVVESGGDHTSALATVGAVAVSVNKRDLKENRARSLLLSEAAPSAGEKDLSLEFVLAGPNTLFTKPRLWSGLQTNQISTSQVPPEH